jgi:hypothetical protein
MWNEAVWPNLKYCPGIHLQGPMQTMNILSQDIRHTNNDSNRQPPECKSEGYGLS